METSVDPDIEHQLNVLLTQHQLQQHLSSYIYAMIDFFVFFCGVVEKTFVMK
jgi:hypothetical protein